MELKAASIAPLIHSFKSSFHLACGILSISDAYTLCSSLCSIHRFSTSQHPDPDSLQFYVANSKIFCRNCCSLSCVSHVFPRNPHTRKFVTNFYHSNSFASAGYLYDLRIISLHAVESSIVGKNVHPEEIFM